MWRDSSIRTFHLYRKFVLLALPAVLSFVAVTSATGVCKGVPNMYGFSEGNPTFLAQVSNGKLYRAGSDDDALNIVHVWGTPYEQGYAHGTLLAKDINTILPSFYKHVLEEVEQYAKGLPVELQRFIAEYGLEAALDLTYEFTKEYTAPDVFEELQGVYLCFSLNGPRAHMIRVSAFHCYRSMMDVGISAGAGIDYKLLRNVHMLPELVKAGCSMFSAWGSALANSSGFLQLRSLDWDTAGGLQDYPTVIVYHPEGNTSNGHPYMSIGWSGFIATLTGMSSARLGVSQKHSDIPFGTESRIGYPFPFLMRDILRHDTNLYEAVERIQRAHRTCSIWLGVGDGNDSVKQGRIFQYSYSTDTVLSDANFTRYTNETRFKQEGCDNACYENYTVEDAVYFGVSLGCWNEQMHENHGRIDINAAINMTAAVQTGNLHLAFYDLQDMKVYTANARGHGESGPEFAYDRRFVQLDASDLFDEAPPRIKADGIHSSTGGVNASDDTNDVRTSRIRAQDG